MGARPRTGDHQWPPGRTVLDRAEVTPRPGLATGRRSPAAPLYGRTKERVMNEAEQYARRALQESMDLRDQGHSDE